MKRIWGCNCRDCDHSEVKPDKSLWCIPKEKPCRLVAGNCRLNGAITRKFNHEEKRRA